MEMFHSDCSHQTASICISTTSKSLGPTLYKVKAHLMELVLIYNERAELGA